MSFDPRHLGKRLPGKPLCAPSAGIMIEEQQELLDLPRDRHRRKSLVPERRPAGHSEEEGCRKRGLDTFGEAERRADAAKADGAGSEPSKPAASIDAEMIRALGRVDEGPVDPDQP